MYLVDTSVWIDFFRNKKVQLTTLLIEKLVLTHEFIILELSAGSIPRRKQTLLDLKTLDRVPTLDTDTISQFIEDRKLYSKGLSLVDIHLIGSCLAYDAELLTADKKLQYHWLELRKENGPGGT
jgi:predicted nucleic acid-binding protein